MLRILIVAALLMLVTATGAQAGPLEMREGGIMIRLLVGAGAGAQAVLQPAVRASVASVAMDRTINGAAPVRPAGGGQGGMLALLQLAGDKPGLALPVSESVSLGLRYQYLRREDMRLDVAETASLDDEYSSHNVVLRARWKF